MTTDFAKRVVFPATVLLFSQQDNGSLKFNCTATAVSHDGNTYIFATAAHCSPNSNSTYVSLDESGTDKTFSRVDNLMCNKRDDVCLISVVTHKKFQTVELDSNDPQIGDAIFTVCSPAGLGKQILRGYVALDKIDRSISSTTGQSWRGNALLQLPGVMGGASGAGAICEDSHKLCGIVVGVYTEQMGGLQVVVPVSKLKSLIAKGK